MNFRKCKECGNYKLIVGNGKCNTCYEGIDYTFKLWFNKSVEQVDKVAVTDINSMKEELQLWVKKDDHNAYKILVDDKDNEVNIKIYYSSDRISDETKNCYTNLLNKLN